LWQIIIGLHGDELMSALWMKATARSTVIQIFEEGGFTRGSRRSWHRGTFDAVHLLMLISGDYELLASSCNHRYIAIHKDRVLDEDGWRSIGNKRGEDAKVSDNATTTRNRASVRGCEGCARGCMVRKLMTQGELRVDGRFVVGLIEGILDATGH
jgi:hypothetical protein